jgi:hypothetical protein
MHPSYATQQVNKLQVLSDWMLAEMDSTSARYWDKHSHFISLKVQELISLCEKARNTSQLNLLTSELWIDPWLFDQHNRANLMIHDPFLPKEIRIKVSDFYLKRVMEMSDIYTQVMTKLCSDLFHGKLMESDKEIESFAWIRLNDAYFNDGWGWEATHNKIRTLLTDIETYLINLQ